MTTLIAAIKIRLSHVLLTALAISLIVSVPRAQPPATTPQLSEDRVALYQALLDLQNPWTVMCVAAHPDDEDGTSLIVMRHKYGAHTVSLFSTFGEGGQNAIGPELYEELGAIRARETMAAAEIQGSEPHFLGLKDFGFSKTRDEAFKFWGHEEALRRMVLEIRRLRPDVIITNHSTTSNDHGQHQATALMVVEAFDAAADPKRFPEQLKDGVTTWQVQRLFVRARGNQASAPDAQIVTIDPNEKDPIRGVVYAEAALRALQQHATQGPWPKTFAEYANRFRAFSGQQGGAPGQLPMIRYALVREPRDAAPMPKDSHNFLNGLRLPDNDAEIVTPPTINGRPLTDPSNQPQQIREALDRDWKRLSGHLAMMALGAEAWRDRATLHYARLYLAILFANGVSPKLVGPDTVIPGRDAKFSLIISNNGPLPIQLHEKSAPWAERASVGNLFAPCCTDITSTEVLSPGRSKSIEVNYSVPASTRVTVPNSSHLYDDNFFLPSLITSVDLKIGPSFDSPVAARKLIDVVPAVEIADIAPSPAILTPAAGSTDPKRISFTIKLTNHQLTAFDGNLIAADNPADRRLGSIPVTLAPGETKTIRFMVGRTDGSINFFLQGARVSSPHKSVPVVHANARVAPSLRVGYIRGFDFSLPNALNALGTESKELSVDDVKTADLSKFTSIIVDNRVYESKPELIAVNQKLLDYANAGGNLIVFYHKSDEWNPDERRKRPQLAPYKLILGNERITDENAPITFIEPDHPLLNTPNKLNQDDFKDWIQERGLYYPKEWDPQFHALLQSNDPGEAPLKGGLLVADYGRGHYIYTSMVWYRELRGGIPGAYRMLANMISYGRK